MPIRLVQITRQTEELVQQRHAGGFILAGQQFAHTGPTVLQGKHRMIAFASRNNHIDWESEAGEALDAGEPRRSPRGRKRRARCPHRRRVRAGPRRRRSLSTCGRRRWCERNWISPPHPRPARRVMATFHPSTRSAFCLMHQVACGYASSPARPRRRKCGHTPLDRQDSAGTKEGDGQELALLVGVGGQP